MTSRSPQPPAADDMLLTDLLRRWAAERPHQRAFTYVQFPDLGSAGRHRTLTWSQLHARAQHAAALVRSVARPGERVALLLPQGLDYVAGFLGCLLARVVAVPLFSPDLPGHEDRVTAVIEDCEPSCALVTPESMQAALRFGLPSNPGGMPLLVIGGEGAEQSAAEERGEPPADPDELAYLQYTSGSTREPAGVMISHRNVVANARQALSVFREPDAASTSVGWLPLFHDMGLLLSVAAPLVGGFPSVLMDPIAFLEKPERWLRLLGLYPGVLSAAPNFAYDYCVGRVDPRRIADLRLDQVRVLVNGSEPVRMATVRRFQEVFAAAGLRPEAHCPSYGLAEATVFVTTDGPRQEPHELPCSRDALADGRIEPLADAARQAADAGSVASLVTCGGPVGQELRIVDPVSGAPLPDGAVGEIAVRGPNVGMGYWKRSERNAGAFGLALPGVEGGPWLRTGDLGALHDGALLVTGRIKDLLIVDGRNHYPQDVEQTVQDALDCVRRDRIAVFALPGDDGRTVTAVAEHRRGLTPDAGLRELADRTARARISTAHGLRLQRLLLVPPGSVPRTSSGKVSRSACRSAFLRGEYELYDDHRAEAV
jgi:acyl-CoA synthetase (AMP-forming)/AMP-acid ligase II